MKVIDLNTEKTAYKHMEGGKLAAKQSISAQISPEDYTRGKEMGIKWGYLVHLGLDSIELKRENTRLMLDNERLVKALGRLQRAILDNGGENVPIQN